MKIINKQEKELIKTFLNIKEAKFIEILNLRYEIDYYYGLSIKMLKGKRKLNMKIEDWNLETKNKIINYINNSNDKDEKIYYYLLKIIISIAHKYYNEDGIINNN